MRKVTIYFEDHGQDFLEWDIDILSSIEGRISASRPCEQSWVGCHILLDKETKEGDKITFTRDFKEAREINYPVNKIEVK